MKTVEIYVHDIHESLSIESISSHPRHFAARLHPAALVLIRTHDVDHTRHRMQANLRGPLPLPPGLVSQRTQAVQAIASDLRKALIANETRATPRGLGATMNLGPRARGTASTVRDSSGGGGGGGGTERDGSGPGRWGIGNRGHGAGGMNSGSRRGNGTTNVSAGGRRNADQGRGFYTEPDINDIYLYVDDADGEEEEEEDPDSEYESPRVHPKKRPRRGTTRGATGHQLGGGSSNGTMLSREERRRRREQAVLDAANASVRRRGGSSTRR